MIFWQLGRRDFERRADQMSKAKFAAILCTGVVLAFAAPGKALAIGDGPHWPAPYNWEPAIQSGCWKWNWQQYSWYDYCPKYISPKAYIYSRRGAVLRSRY